MPSRRQRPPSAALAALLWQCLIARLAPITTTHEPAASARIARGLPGPCSSQVASHRAGMLGLALALPATQLQRHVGRSPRAAAVRPVARPRRTTRLKPAPRRGAPPAAILSSGPTTSSRETEGITLPLNYAEVGRRNVIDAKRLLCAPRRPTDRLHEPPGCIGSAGRAPSRPAATLPPLPPPARLERPAALPQLMGLQDVQLPLQPAVEKAYEELMNTALEEGYRWVLRAP